MVDTVITSLARLTTGSGSSLRFHIMHFPGDHLLLRSYTRSPLSLASGPLYRKAIAGGLPLSPDECLKVAGWKPRTDYYNTPAQQCKRNEFVGGVLICP